MTQGISRRGVLTSAGILGGLALVPTLTRYASAAEPTEVPQTVPRRPVTKEAFEAEFVDATILFPYELPADSPFPTSAPEGGQESWLSGDGEATAYIWWLVAVERAVVGAADRGDDESRSYWLNVASQWPLTEARVLAVADPQNSWATQVFQPVEEQGNLSPMRSHIEDAAARAYRP
ncbi:hypothetical protein GCM10027071_00050 [Microbacterium marinum]